MDGELRKVLYFLRNCEADGTGADAPLRRAGALRAQELAGLLADSGISTILSSPARRARDSVGPLAERLDLPIRIDERLREWFLGATGSEWAREVERSFEDVDLVFPGGESNRAASERCAQLLSEVVSHGSLPALLSSHGSTLVLLLRYFEPAIGWAEWSHMTSPDLYRVEMLPKRATVNHLGLGRH